MEPEQCQAPSTLMTDTGFCFLLCLKFFCWLYSICKQLPCHYTLCPAHAQTFAWGPVKQPKAARMDGPEDDVLVAAGDGAVQADAWTAFKMPFPVATILDLELRAYFNRDNECEWLWSRAHTQLKINQEHWKMLYQNQQAIVQHLAHLEVSHTEFKYRGKEHIERDAQWKDHTFHSRGFLAMLLWVCKNRPLKPESKRISLKMLQDVAKRAFFYTDSQGMQQSELVAMIVNQEGTLKSEPLTFNQVGGVEGLSALLHHFPPAVKTWQKLRRRLWNGQCISTDLGQASMDDLWFFLAYLQAHQTLRVEGRWMWPYVVKPLLPPLLQLAGQWLDAWAWHLSQEVLQELPIMKTKCGKAQRALDPVNRMVLLFKLRREKIHRRRVGLSHEGILPLQGFWARYEDVLDVVLHIKALQTFFEGHPPQLSVSWDPGTYGGKSTNVTTFFSCHFKQGGYLLNQQVAKLMKSEVEDSIIKDKHQGSKLTRVEGYNELRGLCSAIFHSTGLPLEDFQKPMALLVRPLKQDELRVKGQDGKWYIYNAKNQEIQAVVPEGLSLADVPCLVSCSDQGPNNVACLNYLQFSKEAIMLICHWDPSHRCWNDIKNPCRRSSFGAWRVVLELVVFFNINFGPFGSGTWWYRKRAMLEEFLTSEAIHGETWSKYQHLIAEERRMEEPSCPDDQEALFQEMRSLQNFVGKGPLVKLMRWFSFFECCATWEGEFWATKMIMEYGLDKEGDALEGNPEEDVKETKPQDDRAQLAELKRRKGTFRLAPHLVTGKSMAVKDILMSVCRATWKMHAQRVRDVKSPEQMMRFHIACAGKQQLWKEELAMIVDTSLNRINTLQHLTPAFSTHASVLEWQVEMFSQLMETRAMSLTSFHCLPPLRYAHVLSEDAQEAHAGQGLAVAEFQALLQAEAAALQMQVKPLASLFWAKNPLIRTMFLAHEQDQEQGTDAAKKLQTIVCKTFGDTRSVENCHQHARDLLRSSRHQTFGNTKTMANTLKSGALDERLTPQQMVRGENADKVQAHGAYTREPVKGKLTSKGFKLPLSIQKMMLPKSKASGHEWPSPSPASLFESVAASEWIFSFFQNPEQYMGKSVNSPWLSVMAKPGFFLAQESTSLLMMCVASAHFGFLAWEASVKKKGEETIYLFPPLTA